ncbi:MAG: M48 family metallopeptidase [Chloroflexota bacterium]
MKPVHNTSYRYPHEQTILTLTLLLVFGVIFFTATATVCGSVVFVAAMLIIAYFATSNRHQSLLKTAQEVTPQTNPRLNDMVEECRATLQTEAVQTFVANRNALNAYTFGLTSPKVVVIYSALAQVMDEDELKFIVGHELGHVTLGHTWLNSLVGGMAGIPSPFMGAILMEAAFLWWNRACEYSADRAGLLACGDVNKGISALLKIGVGLQVSQGVDPQRALQKLRDEMNDTVSTVGELFATHPLIARRIDELKKWAASAEYKKRLGIGD